MHLLNGASHPGVVARKHKGSSRKVRDGFYHPKYGKHFSGQKSIKIINNDDETLSTSAQLVSDLLFYFKKF
jgi:hypothetical protein